MARQIDSEIALAHKPVPQIGPLLILGGMFFIFGFVTWLNGPLITFVRLAFTLDDLSAFLVPMAFYMSYFFLALPSAWILKRTGMKNGMALGLLIMAVGAATFGQFATMRVFPGALTGLFIIGAGLAILQTASNPYISIVGPIESAASRIAVMGICNKVAGFLAPFVFGYLVMDGIGALDAQIKSTSNMSQREALLNGFASKIHMPYLAMAALLALLAMFVAKSSLPNIHDSANSVDRTDADTTSLFSQRQLWLGVIALFFYVGVEVMAGDAIGTYGRSFGLPLQMTAFFTSFTLGAMLVGYVAGLLVIPRFMSQERYLALSAVLAIFISITAYMTTGYLSVGCIAALGFANAMMWPAIFPLGIKGLGRHTEAGSAIMIMGIAGGAVLPQIFAHLKATHNFQLVFLWVTVPAYLYILLFAVFCGRETAASLPASQLNTSHEF